MDLNRVLPLVLLTIPWLLAVVELRRGVRTGRMREYLRTEYTEVPNERSPKYCDRRREPRTFWCLFAFYTAVLVLIPVGMVFAIVRRLTGSG